MKLGALWCMLAVVISSSNAGQWRWPESASVRIDTKIGFIENEHGNNKHSQANRQDDDVFHEPSETEGFYNRPPGSGRYPVRIEGHRNQAYRTDGHRHAIYPLRNDQKTYPSINNNDGTLESLQYCKCVSTPECNPHQNSEAACGVGRYLCCFKRPNKVTPQNTEFFNEVEDERPMLLPGRENLARPFPPPPGSEVTGFYGSFDQGHDNTLAAPFKKQQPAILVGPGGPTGVVGPPTKTEVLVGPGGPTGVIGPAPVKDDTRQMFFNIVEDQLSMLLPGRETLARPFPPPRLTDHHGVFALFGPGKDNSRIGVFENENQGILVGPDVPKDVVGPQSKPTNRNSASIGRGIRDPEQSFVPGFPEAENLGSVYKIRMPLLLSRRYPDPVGIIGTIRSKIRKNKSLHTDDCDCNHIH